MTFRHIVQQDRNFWNTVNTGDLWVTGKLTTAQTIWLSQWLQEEREEKGARNHLEDTVRGLDDYIQVGERKELRLTDIREDAWMSKVLPAEAENKEKGKAFALELTPGTQFIRVSLVVYDFFPKFTKVSE